MCNASAGSGKYELNGFCYDGGKFFMLTLTQNSLDFNRVVNFRNNTLYYLTSKYGCVYYYTSVTYNIMVCCDFDPTSEFCLDSYTHAPGRELAACMVHVLIH